VRGVKKFCSCESVDVVEGAVVPAGGVLNVKYWLSKYGFGERSGKLVITTDAEELSLRTIELSLHAIVQPKLWATPAEVELSDASGGEQILRVESVVPGLLDRFKDATTNRGNVLVSVEERSPSALALRVALSPDAPWGTFYDFIYLSFDSREHPSLNIRVKGRKGHPLAVFPAALSAPTNIGAASRHNVRIMSPAGAAFRVMAVDAPDGISVERIHHASATSVDVEIALTRISFTHRLASIVFQTEPPGAATVAVRYPPCTVH